ncbi:MAG: hypothetical protein ABSC22_14070 [Roseiarcus sp.]|jgi:hypothetical protein
MTILTFILGLLLVVAGAGWLIGSINMLPTEIGLIYILCGTLALSAGVMTIAIGVLTRRLDVFAVAVESLESRASWRDAPATREEPVAPHEPEAHGEEEPREPIIGEEPAAVEGDSTALAEDEPVNENRSGHLPTMATIEHALGEPEAAPTLVGHYSAGGANYKIFSDGSIEAETESGAFKFASMADFKAYLAGARG